MKDHEKDTRVKPGQTPSVDEPLEYDAVLGAEDYAAYSLELSRPQWATRRILFAAIPWTLSLCLSLILGMWWAVRREVDLGEFARTLPERLRGDAVWPAVIYLAFVALFVMWRRWGLPGAARSSYGRLLAGGLCRSRVRLDERGVSFRRPEGYEGRVEWRAFQSWIETPERHLLRFGPLDALILPTRGLSDGERERLRARIGSQVEPKRV
jgi:hypothetical protein